MKGIIILFNSGRKISLAIIKSIFILISKITELRKVIQLIEEV